MAEGEFANDHPAWAAARVRALFPRARSFDAAARAGAPQRTKYDDLVYVLADGLFEILATGDSWVPIPRKRMRRKANAPGGA